MRRALLLAGALMLVSAPLHAYVSSGSVMGKRLSPTTTTSSTGTTDFEVTDPYAEDPTIGIVDVKKDKKIHRDEASNPVPEPGTMAITSMGLLAAAALRKRRAKKEQQKQS